MTISKLIAEAIKVLNATEPGENTPDRVGNILKGTLEHLETLVTNVSNNESALSAYPLIILDLLEETEYSLVDLVARDVVCVLTTPAMGGLTVTLPDAVNNIGKRLLIKVIGGGITINCVDAQLVDGKASVSIAGGGVKEYLCISSTDWIVI